MRSYLEIIIDLQDGKEVDYEEARLAALAGSYMLHSSEKDIKRLTGYATPKEATDFKSTFAISQYENRYKSKKLPVDKFLGSWHPDAPGRQEERKIHQKIYDKFMQDKKE